MDHKSRSHLSLVPRVSGRVPRARFVCLVVDDDAQSRHALAEIVAGADLDVVTASGAPEALRILHEQCVDLVVTEEYLPGASGSDLLDTVRFSWPNVGRVLVGRELGPDVILQAVNRARVQRVLYKKMSAHTLRAEIEAALNETLLERDVRVSLRAAANK